MTHDLKDTRALDGSEWLCLCGGGTFHARSVAKCPRCGMKQACPVCFKVRRAAKDKDPRCSSCAEAGDNV